MRNRSHPRCAVVLCLVLLSGARSAAGEPPSIPVAEADLVELEPARAAQEALAPLVVGSSRAVHVTIEAPDEGAIFSDSPFADFVGSLETLGDTGRVDAVVVVDTSASTGRFAEQRNRVRDRHRARYDRWQEPPSILDHEIRSIEWMMEELDPRKTRLGLVTFAGDGMAPHARTEVALTRRFEALDAGLQRVRRRGAAGRTDMAAGLEQAIAELEGRGASRPERGAARVVVFLTDGMPTLPHEATRDNEQEVFRAAERAASAGLRVFSFAIGPEALRRPVAAAEMARRTGGAYTPVRKPRQLADAVSATVDFGSVGGELLVRNASLKANASELHLREGGTFGGRIPLRTGRNRIFIRAAVGPHAAEATRSIHYAPGSVRVFSPPVRAFLPVRTLPTQRALEIGTGQRRTIDLHLGEFQRKQLEVGVSPPAAPGEDAR